MATTLQFRRGNTSQNDAFTGAEGELAVDTQLDQLRLHDGSTAGGFKVARQVDLDDKMSVANTQALFSSVVANVVSTTNVQNYMAVTNAIALVGARLGATATVTFVGDITGSNSFSSNATSVVTTLADTGTPTGTFGSGSLIPVVTVDSKGRITNISNTSVAGVSALDYYGANSTLRITTADSQEFDATISTNDKITVANAQALHTALSANISQSFTDIQATNTAIRSLVTTESGRVDLLNTNLTGTNTAIRALTTANANKISQVESNLLASNTAIRSYVDNEVANLVDSAPATLDTLNELAAALGDDPNFATTLSTNLGQKLGGTASVTLTGDVSGSASFSANAVSIITTVADDSHNHIISNVDGLQDALNNRMQVANTNTLLADKMSVANTQALVNARLGSAATIRLSGDVSAGPTAFSGNSVSLEVTVADDSHNHVISNVDGLEAALDNRMTVANTQSLVNARLGSTATVQLTGDVSAGPTAFSGNAVSLSVTVADDSHNHIISNVDGLQDALNNRMTVANTQALANARLGSAATITLTGDVSAGPTAFSSNAVSLSVTVADDSHNHIISNVDGLQTALDNKMSVANTQSLANARLGATATVQITGDVAGGPTAFSGNTVSIAVTQQNNSVDLGTHTTGNYVATVSGTANEIEVSGSGSETAAVTIGLPNDVTVTGDLTVSGGDITLGGTGRIQGIDTVSSGTDAANKTYVDNAVAGVVDSAPAALDTLNELAAALGDDANFATTVSTNIGQKLGATATVQISGDVAGGPTAFSGNTVNISVTQQNNSVDLGTHTTGNYVATITGGTGIASSGATSGEGIAHSLSVDLSELTDMTAGMVGTDEFIVLDAGADRRKAASEIGLSIFNNDAGFSTTTGTVTSIGITAGNLIDVSGSPVTSSGNITVNVDLSELTDGTADIVGSEDELVYLDNGSQKRKLVSEIAIGQFNTTNQIALGTDTTGNYVATITGGTGLTSSGATSGEGIAHSLSVDYGTTSGTACQGNDARLSDSRTCDNTFDSASTARTNLGLGSLATLSTVNAATITDNSVGAAELNVTGNGTSGQYLASDGDGTMTWTTLAAGYGDSDVESYLSGGTGVSFSSGVISIGQAVGTGNAVTFASVTATGDITANSSDRRLKNVSGNIENAVEKVKALNGVHFTWNETAAELDPVNHSTDKQNVGLIAQEVEAVLPEVIRDAPIGEGYLTLMYDRVVPLLVEAIKEQQEQIEELKAKLAE